MNPPLVSIALVTFNGETHLPAQLESLLQQSHPALELVACDDASTDGTWQVLERFAPRFEARGTGVRLLRNPDNIGVRRNVEQALRQCSGSWIAPCDQDTSGALTRSSECSGSPAARRWSIRTPR